MSKIPTVHKLLDDYLFDGRGLSMLDFYTLQIAFRDMHLKGVSVIDDIKSYDPKVKAYCSPHRRTYIMGELKKIADWLEEEIPRRLITVFFYDKGVA